MTIKYAQIANEETKQVNVGLGDDVAFYKSIGMTEMDVEQAYNGGWYLKGYAPIKPEPTPKEKILARISLLESAITDRNMRAALLGDEYAMSKITSIEAEIAELRKQL